MVDGCGQTWQTHGFGLYVHYPFCLAKCPYCDFNSHVSGAVDDAAWRRAYLGELRRVAAETPGRVLSSIFFGGGTPSLMPPDTAAAIIAEAARLWPVSADLEVTLEANPTSSEAGRFRAFRQAGVTRASVGVQSLRDPDLRRLGRLHSAAEAVAAVEMAAATFDRVSLDLIYARQDQDAAAWRAELAEALAIGTTHLSLYQLTIEPGTAFGSRHAAGKLRGLPGDDLSVALWEVTQELCGAAGRPAYEISNHAAPGAEGRHNLIYWRGGDYAGIGPGAHGRLDLDQGRVATEAIAAPAAWLAAVQAGSGELPRTTVPEREAAEEYLMMALRLAEGAERRRLAAIAMPEARLAELEEAGLISLTPERLAVTERGRLLLNAVLRTLLSE